LANVTTGRAISSWRVEGGAGGGSMQALIGILLSGKGMGLLTGPAANDTGRASAEAKVPAE